MLDNNENPRRPLRSNRRPPNYFVPEQSSNRVQEDENEVSGNAQLNLNATSNVNLNASRSMHPPKVIFFMTLLT